jgi:hypothetical protein
MAMRIGAALGNMREAWWVPMIDVERPEHGTVAWQVNGERSRPHCIIVKRRRRPVHQRGRQLQRVRAPPSTPSTSTATTT